MNLNDFIVNIFCEVDDFMKNNFPARKLRTRGPLPQLADSEEFFKRFYRHYFPKLTNRVNFVRHAAKLWAVKQWLFEYITRRFADTIVVLDSFPIPVCRFARAKSSKLFKGIANYGKELGNQTFYGFRLHIKINSIGMIASFKLAPANIHDIHMVPELTFGDRGLLLADRAYLSEPLKSQLLENQGLELSVPTKYGKPTELSVNQLRFRKRIRRLIETVGNQLAGNLHIKKIWARDLWHLANRICRRILAHTFSALFCLRRGLSPLSFSKLVTV